RSALPIPTATRILSLIRRGIHCVGPHPLRITAQDTASREEPCQRCSRGSSAPTRSASVPAARRSRGLRDHSRASPKRRKKTATRASTSGFTSGTQSQRGLNWGARWAKLPLTTTCGRFISLKKRISTPRARLQQSDQGFETLDEVALFASCSDVRSSRERAQRKWHRLSECGTRR